ncbi:helix-turn-helix domain-containing protein [Paenibacillus hexagrammi]|uniref:Helix-turn-helix transcriptional regulator n=1 Tax=Paenibacillus hexagrammi TaxID=2908839 RepID=A0ABY3SRE6_9BACL|nr:helix-turn-helix transcriptional regulator [Paenibacillus sp. YPD9-1]UJF36603.1 helix-turn-helix transcriptional regulator [Paenibacillus sp. YPD9-1]
MALLGGVACGTRYARAHGSGRTLDRGRFILIRKRKSHSMTLQVVADQIGISKNYLSEIENGKKGPNDEIIASLARIYGLNEEELFEKYGKISLGARKYLEGDPKMQKALAKISKNKKLTDEDKARLADNLMSLYDEILNSK